MLQNPEYIPCCTSHPEKAQGHETCLLSIKPETLYIRAQKQTIIDCRTFGLRLNRQIDPIKHYFWYIDAVSELLKEPGLVFIAVDSDWLGTDAEKKVSNYWLKKIETDQVLVVPETLLFGLLDKIAGYAIRPKQLYTHPIWTHSFSNAYGLGPKDTKRWSFDSSNKCK